MPTKYNLLSTTKVTSNVETTTPDKEKIAIRNEKNKPHFQQVKIQ
jgi:hypothetical protein